MVNTITSHSETSSEKLSPKKLLKNLAKKKKNAISKEDFLEAHRIKQEMYEVKKKLNIKEKKSEKGKHPSISEEKFKASLQQEKQQDQAERKVQIDDLMGQLNDEQQELPQNEKEEIKHILIAMKDQTKNELTTEENKILDDLIKKWDKISDPASAEAFSDEFSKFNAKLQERGFDVEKPFIEMDDKSVEFLNKEKLDTMYENNKAKIESLLGISSEKDNVAERNGEWKGYLSLDMLDVVVSMNRFHYTFEPNGLYNIEEEKEAMKEILLAIKEKNLTSDEKQQIDNFVSQVERTKDSTGAKTLAEDFKKFMYNLQYSGRFNPDEEFIKIKNPMEKPEELGAKFDERSKKGKAKLDEILNN